MVLTLNNPDLVPFDNAEDLNVVVAYEDWPAAVRARELLRRVGRQCGESGRLIYSMWKFHVLAEPTLRAMAAAEVTSADIVVFSAKDGPNLPNHVKKWINRWLPTKGGRRTAMVALLKSGEPQTWSAGGIQSYLEEVAKAGHMELFCQTCRESKELPLEEPRQHRPAIQVNGQTMSH